MITITRTNSNTFVLPTFRRLWDAARNCGLHDDDATSCRLICSKYMCGDVDPFTPSQWNEDCVTRKCRQCPPVAFSVPPGRGLERVTFSMWTTKDVGGRRQFGLFNVTKSLDELCAELTKKLPELIAHIYGAALAWAKTRKDESELRPGIDLICFEDYQRNFELFHAEMPTSMAYSANNLQFAMYPIGLKFRRVEGGPVETAAVIFVSTDLRHGHQQVKAMENW